MNRDKYHVIILISKLHYLMHPALVILHSHKTAEHTHTIVDMNDVITYSKRSQVIDSELLTLLYRPSDIYTMEPVEDLVVAIAADLVFIINETVMKIALSDEFRENTTILRKNGLKSLQLRLLFTIYPYSESSLYLSPDILGKKFEILIEHRLRGDAELDGLLVLTGQRKFHIYIPEPLQILEEGLILVHIGRVHPYESALRKDIRNHHTLPFLVRRKVRIYIHILNLLL